jgi:hypothetical protein
MQKYSDEIMTTDYSLIDAKYSYHISANSCRDNYSFLEALGATTIQGRQLFKGGNY